MMDLFQQAIDQSSLYVDLLEHRKATAMDPAEITYRMKRAGVTQAAIAKKLGITPPTVCNVIKGTATSARVKTAIAKALGLRVEEIWPDNRAA